MDARHHVRAGEREDFVAALPAVEIADGELSRKLHPLQRRAHGAVENDHAAGGCIEKVLVCHTKPRTLARAASCYPWLW